MRRKNRHNRTGWVAGFILIFLLIGIGRDARADLPEILLKFQPYIWVDETYTNNVDLTKTNKKSDFITTISPGIRFSTVARSPVTGELRQQPLWQANWDGDRRLKKRRPGLSSITARVRLLRERDRQQLHQPVRNAQCVVYRCLKTHLQVVRIFNPVGRASGARVSGVYTDLYLGVLC